MKRSGWLNRRAPMSKVAGSAGARNVNVTSKLPPSQPKESRRVENEDYLDTCRSSKTPHVRCMAKRLLGAAIDDCWGPVEPDHQRDMTGGGTKESDVDAAPQCRNHHMQIEAFKLPSATTRTSRKSLRTVCNATHHADLRRAGHPAAPPVDSAPSPAL